MDIEFRRVFDTIPEQFDRCRSRYCTALFDKLIELSGINKGSRVLELGPGTGQATEPVLNTGCDYLAIELGENFSDFLRSKYGCRSNFHLINDDFITHDFRDERVDMIFSAATIQWIPEPIAFGKTFSLLKSGGTLAMMMTRSDYKSRNEELFSKIQSVYEQFFRPEHPYEGGFVYKNAVNYGFIDYEVFTFERTREFTADQYIDFIGTHCDHLTISEPYRTPFYKGIWQAIWDAGNKLTAIDSDVLILTRKPK